ncbi:MAG TPA: FAD-binding oxidoreductase [Methylocella sp.]|nr:FAD-binding oxidoreductase [Methylocella sp.]
MSTRTCDEKPGEVLDERAFWQQAFAARPRTVVATHDAKARKTTISGERRNSWVDRLFAGRNFYAGTSDKMVISKNGVEIDEIPISELAPDTVIGRHPEAHIQLEAYKLGSFHIVIRKKDGRLYAEAIDVEHGILLDRKKVKTGTPVPLWDGAIVDIPGYRLRFHLADCPMVDGAEMIETEELAEIPCYFYTPPPPPPCPVLVNLIEDRERIGIWSEGVATLKLADIIEETPDVKTFRLVGEKPLLFSYRPGQFVTFLLNIDGVDVERSYSMSSSPSRPHVLEITVKRVPGGLVSNWLCDHVKLGQSFTIKGPAGKFSCFTYPTSKMLFIGAGSGITPLMSMSRWIGDTTADVDVKFLASFKTPQDIIFRKELELISARHSRFRVAINLTSTWGKTESWTGLTGRINTDMVRILVPDLNERHVFLCGPEPFAAQVKKSLQELGFNFANFHAESFGTGRVAGGVKGKAKALQLSEPRHRVRFMKSDRVVEADEKVTLLELAEAHGIEIEYACRSGGCGACEVKFSGKLSEKADFDVTPRCKESGRAFACCSVALADLEVEA